MKCKSCRADIQVGSDKCPYCRTKYGAEELNYIQNTNNFVQNNQFQNNQVQNNLQMSNYNQGYNSQMMNYNQNIPKKKNNVGLIVVLIIIGVIVLGFGLLFFVGLIGSFIDDVDSNNDYSFEENYNDNYIDDNTSNNISSGTSNNKVDRTIMIYMIGSNLESEAGYASADIQEMIDSNFNTNDVRVLLYVGGTKKWQNTIFKTNENAIYEVTGSGITKIKSYSRSLMTKKENITQFMDYVYDNYSSNSYSLIFWDHGAGPFGYGIDEYDSKSETLSIIDIDSAINNSKLIKNQKLELLGFDACLMSSIEIANYFKEEANYLVAAAEIEPGDGWDYEFLKKINKSVSSVQMGKYIVDEYYNYYISSASGSIFGYSYGPEVTLSLIDLSKITPIVTIMDDLFKDVSSTISTNYSKVSRIASNVKMYGYDSSANVQLDLLDLYGLTMSLDDYKLNTSTLKTSINNALIYHKTNISGCNGISIYFPVTTKKYYSNLNQTYNYKTLSISNTYTTFLQNYTKLSIGNKLVNSNISSIVPSQTSSNKISASIPKDLAENYEKAGYVIFKKMKDGTYLPVYKGYDVEINGTTISAKVANRYIVVGDKNGDNIEDVIAIESYSDNDFVVYDIYSTLLYYGGADTIDFSSYKIENVIINLKVNNKTNKGEIINIKPMKQSDDINVMEKITYNLNDWDYMQFTSSSYKLFDSNGNKLDTWEKSGTHYGTEVKLSDGYTFMASSLDKDYEYYYMFQVKDSQGNQYETNLVKAN